MPIDVRGLFVADDHLWYAHGSGSLSRQRLSGVSLVPGTTQLMGGPSLDGIDWRSRALFVGPGPQPPANVPPEAPHRRLHAAELLIRRLGLGRSGRNDHVLGWTFGDGVAASGATATHAFASDGTYSVRLAVTDNRGATTEALRDLTVSAQNVPPNAVIDVTCTDLSCDLSGSASTDSDGSIVSYEWMFEDGTSGTGVAVTHGFPATGTYEVSLTVQDDQGARTTQQQSVSVTAAPATIDFHGSLAQQATFTRATVDMRGGTETGDALLLFATLNSLTPTIQPPAGWTEIGRQTAGTMATVSWSADRDRGRPGIERNRGAKPDCQDRSPHLRLRRHRRGCPVSAFASNADLSATDTHTSPTVTVPHRDSWVVTYYADKSSNTTAWISPSGVAMRSASDARAAATSPPSWSTEADPWRPERLREDWRREQTLPALGQQAGPSS